MPWDSRNQIFTHTLSVLHAKPVLLQDCRTQVLTDAHCLLRMQSLSFPSAAGLQEADFHSYIAFFFAFKAYILACIFNLLRGCRNISESMKGLWKNSTTRRSQVSASLMDKPKVCSYCGTVGHNRRGCPKLHPEKQHTEKVRVNVCIVFRVLGIKQRVLGKLSQNQRIFTPANGSGIHVGLSTACTA